MGLIKPCQEVMAAASKNVSRGDWESHQKTVSRRVEIMASNRHFDTLSSTRVEWRPKEVVSCH